MTVVLSKNLESLYLRKKLMLFNGTKIYQLYINYLCEFNEINPFQITELSFPLFSNPTLNRSFGLFLTLEDLVHRGRRKLS